MPPRSKAATKTYDEIMKDDNVVPFAQKWRIKEGSLVNIVINGTLTYKNSKVLELIPDGVYLETALQGLSRAEVTYVPLSAIEGVGLVGERA